MNEQLTQALAQALGGEQADPLQTALIQQIAESGSAPEEADVSLREQLEECERRVRRLGTEVAAANAMVEWVAEALGACPSCWGLNRFCRRCLGAGQPGSAEPDVERLVEWIAPALSRAGQTVMPIPPAEVPADRETEGAPNGDERER